MWTANTKKNKISYIDIKLFYALNESLFNVCLNIGLNMYLHLRIVNKLKYTMHKILKPDLMLTVCMIFGSRNGDL